MTYTISYSSNYRGSTPDGPEKNSLARKRSTGKCYYYTIVLRAGSETGFIPSSHPPTLYFNSTCAEGFIPLSTHWLTDAENEKTSLRVFWLRAVETHRGMGTGIGAVVPPADP